MADVKIGFNQVNKPAPLNYRRFLNAYIVAGTPALTTFVMSIGLSDHGQKIAMACIVLSAATAKGLGMILGNGQIYSPSNSVVDAQSTKN